MALIKYTPENAKALLKRAPYREFEFARLAQLNHLIDQIEASASNKTLAAVPALDVATLTGTTIADLRAELNVQLGVIETKINAIITALS